MLQCLDRTNVICLTEHWKEANDLKTIKIMNYELSSSYCRKNSIHGGACIYVHKSVEATELDVLVDLSVEMVIEISAIQINYYKLSIVCIYRPPSGDINIFFEKLSILLNITNDDMKAKNTLIVGDFNIDLLKDSPNKKKLLDLMNCVNLNPIVVCPTRYTNCSESCIDHAYSDIDEINFAPVKSELSDHDGQMMSISYQQNDCNTCSVEMIEMRRITPSKLNCFTEFLDMYDWDKIIKSGKEPDQILDSIINVFIHAFVQAFPMQKHPKCNKDKIWFSGDIIAKKYLLDDIKDLCNVFPNNISLHNFKDQFEELYNKLMIYKRSDYFRNEIRKASNKAKAVWRVIQSETSATSSKSRSLESSEPDGLANAINKFFINSVRDTQRQLDLRLALQLLESYNPMAVECASLEPLSIGEIYRLIKLIKPKPTKDVYEVPTRILRELPPSFIDILCYSMNLCLKNGCYPDSLKRIKVVPIYKGKGVKTELKNYRPISIIPVLSKIFELGLANRLINHLTGKGILAKEQYAYQSQKSTVDATRQLLKTIAGKQELGCKVALVLCDLSKAFDLVDHMLIIKKLDHYGIRGTFLKVFESFLKNRQQLCEVDVNGYKGRSNYESLDSISVPQGSVIGNYLFITLVNDLSACTSHGQLIAYADDSAFVVWGTSFTELQSRVNYLLQDVKHWFTINGMKLNLDKTNVIQINLRGSPPQTLNIVLDNIEVPVVNKAKYLGFTLDSALQWDTHIDELCKRLGKACFAISRLTKMLDEQCVRNAYYAYFQSIVTYGIDMWGQAADRQRVLILQKRVIRIMAGVPWDTPARSLFRKLRIMTFPGLYIFEVAKVVRKHLNEYKMRGPNYRNGNNLLPNPHRLKKSEQCVWYIGPRIYNRLPNNLKSSELSDNMFISKLKEYLIEKTFYSLDEFMNKNNVM
jgi:hypothetical protein